MVTNVNTDCSVFLHGDAADLNDEEWEYLRDIQANSLTRGESGYEMRLRGYFTMSPRLRIFAVFREPHQIVHRCT